MSTVASPSRARSAVADPGPPVAPRGSTLDRSLDQDPSPPSEDVLLEPLVLPRISEYALPHETLGSWAITLLGQLGWSKPSEALKRLRRIQTTVATVMASVSPDYAKDFEASDWLTRYRDLGRFKVTSVTHPYDLMDAFRFLPRLPDVLPVEAREARRSLEVALMLVLRQYREELIRGGRTRFSFDGEARAFITRAIRLEMEIKAVTEANERWNLIQMLHDNCYHGRNYYIYSVLSREQTVNDGRMFVMYCQAMLILARLEWDGTLRQVPVLRRLPPRQEAMFLFRLDRNLKQRCLQDAEYMARVKAMLTLFQDRSVF